MDSASKDSFRKNLPRSAFKDAGICLREFCTFFRGTLSTKDSSTESTSSSKSFSSFLILSSNPPAEEVGDGTLATAAEAEIEKKA